MVTVSSPSTPDRAAPIGGVRTTRRRGRMSTAKQTALTTLGTRWGLYGSESIRPDLQSEVATTAGVLTDDSLTDAFGRNAPRLLDIGCGTGEAARAYAEAHPDHDVVAVELHRPGLARLLQDLEAQGPQNVRVLEADATVVIDHLADPGERQNERSVAPSSPGPFHAVRVLFPDPWPKRRHLARRLVDTRFVAQVATILPTGGWVHLATDWDDYAFQMRVALCREPRLIVDIDGGLPPGGLGHSETFDPDDPPTWASPRPDRPVTTYEARGLRAGHAITDLVAHRTAPGALLGD